jgi:uncharacterized membrane protein
MAEDRTPHPLRKAKTGRCGLTNKEYPLRELVPGNTVREPIAALIRQQYPGWDASQYIAKTVLKEFRDQHIRNLFGGQQREITQLEREVLDRVEKAETLSRNLVEESDQQLTFGQRVADHIAEFGGSWTFILSFLGFLAAWIVVNVFFLLHKPFDPYPFILLNLILSCLAALQAPVIMMSQNRQETKDRVRALHDYQVNLKAEIEIRQLHEKLDHLIMQQNQRLFELQQVQLDLLEELLEEKRKK